MFYIFYRYKYKADYVKLINTSEMYKLPKLYIGFLIVLNIFMKLVITNLYEILNFLQTSRDFNGIRFDSSDS